MSAGAAAQVGVAGPSFPERSTRRSAKQRRSEACFFSAWDIHVPNERPERWQLIECNDNENGSGFVFAALLNRIYDETAGRGRGSAIEPPEPALAFDARIARMVAAEARAFFGALPGGLLLIVDDAESLQRGRFRDELGLLRDLLRRAGWRAELGSPFDTTWDGQHLLCRGAPVSFVVNRYRSSSPPQGAGWRPSRARSPSSAGRARRWADADRASRRRSRG